MKKRDYASGSQKMAGNEQIAAEVGKNPNGVGYVGMAYTKAGGVKAMPIDGAVPSVKSVQSSLLSLLASHVLLYERRPEWLGQRVCRFHSRLGWPTDRSPSRLCANQMNRAWLG